jgi:Flp pilus assembly protein TadD
VLVLACAASVPARATEIKPGELQQLSPMCQAALDRDRTRSRTERLQPFAHEIQGTCGIHHTCWGELLMQRYRRLVATPPASIDSKVRAKYEREKKGLLQAAVGEYSYETRCAPPSYPLLPMIHTERGKIRSLQGRSAEAVEEFSRALELDPGYAEARSGLAAAKARATMPRPSR